MKYIHFDGNSLFCSEIKTSNPKGIMLSVTGWFNEHRNNDMLWWKAYCTPKLLYWAATTHSIINTTQPRMEFCEEKLYPFQKILRRSIKVHLDWNSRSCSVLQQYTDRKLNAKQLWRDMQSIFASPRQHYSAFSAGPSKCMPYSIGKYPYLLPGSKTQSFVSILSNFNRGSLVLPQKIF